MSGRVRSHNPHDNLVRYVFSRPEAVGIVVRRVAPAELSSMMDFGSLRALPTVDTDDRLRCRAGDLRFVVDLVDDGVRIPLLLALEHQSTLEALLACRMHEYVGDLWRRSIREEPRRRTVPAVMPIVLAQVPAGATPRRLTDVIEWTPKVRSLLGRVVETEMFVDDLSGSILGDAIAPPAVRALVELTRALLFAYRNPKGLSLERIRVLAGQFDVLLQRNDPLGEADVDALWRYVIAVFGVDSPLRDVIVDAVSRRTREMFMTIQDALLAEGRAAGKAEALLDVLGHRGVAVSESERARVLGTRDESVIQRWLGRALAASSVAELFGGEEGPRSRSVGEG